MGDDRKADYEMAPTSDPENPEPPAEKAELGEEETGSQQWAGLSKEELLRVADTPAWNWTRNILLVLFWIAWVVMLVIAIILVAKAPRCPQVEWYEKSPIYQVYLRSFKDGNDDGYGDLQGVIDNVETIKNEFGADTILLSAVFKQANDTTNFGQETVDFMGIDASLGTLEDFDTLMDKVQVNGMHLILEFDPNHSSDQHEWFIKSKNQEEGYSDFYIWADDANDWTNYKGASAWTYDDTRQQFYYHYYEPSQPDLNFKSEAVVMKIKEIMAFWLAERKVDGFVVADVDRLLEAPVEVNVGRKKRQSGTEAPINATEIPPDMTTEMMTPDGDGGDTGGDTGAGSGGAPTQYDTLDASKLPDDVEELLNNLYEVIYENSYLGRTRVFIPQHSGSLKENVLYEKEEWTGFPRSLGFIKSVDESISTLTISTEVEGLFKVKDPESSQLKNSWSLGYSQVSRIATRASTKAKALTMLMFTLPGTPMPYYGDELLLEDVDGEMGQVGPYPWSGSANGGFSADNKTMPWMPVANNLKEVNFEAQNANKNSTLAYFKKLSMFRKEPSLLAGTYKHGMANSNLFAFTRYFEGWPAYLAVFNFGERQEGSTVMNDAISGTVVVSASGEMDGKEVQLDKLSISENDALLIEYWPSN